MRDSALGACYCCGLRYETIRPDTSLVFMCLASRSSTCRGLLSVPENIPKAGGSIVSTALPLTSIPRFKFPYRKTYMKRMTYLAELEVRNRGLPPLLGYIPSLERWGITGSPKIPKAHEPAPCGNKSTEWERVPGHIYPKDAPELLG